MNAITIKEIIQQELPALLYEDATMYNYVMKLTRQVYADKYETDNQFKEVLSELRRHRDENNKKWDENNKRWDEFKKESDRKFDKVHEAIMAQSRKFDRGIGGLGARWGLRSEQTFRNALAGILEDNFDVKVINVNEFDDAGEVFGYPEQIEIDIIIKNGLLIICELKSSMSNADMYLFERKVRYYERHHKRHADRILAISPMIHPSAEKTAIALGIKTYGDSSDVSSL